MMENSNGFATGFLKERSARVMHGASTPAMPPTYSTRNARSYHFSRKLHIKEVSILRQSCKGSTLMVLWLHVRLEA